MSDSFFDSGLCKSRLHCRLCRLKIGGNAWRVVAIRNFELPGEADFDCPNGKPWQEESAKARPPVIRTGCCGGATSVADVQEQMLRQAGVID